MPGGVIQLLAWGSQNIYLNGNPSITFFKKVFQTHTNFSMESIRLNLNRTDALVYDNTILKAKLDRVGDLVQQIYLVFELPDIISTEEISFRWVDNVGETIIQDYQITIGGNVVDRQYGEFLHCMNSLSLGVDRREVYDKMIGNVPELTKPMLFDPAIPDGHNGLILANYPASQDARTLVSIRGRKVYVPLRFWFNKEPGCALPLVALQYSEAEISITLRPITHIYKVLTMQDGLPQYRGPEPNNPDHKLSNFVSNEFATYITNESTIDLKSYLEVNYIYLDTLERKYLAYNPVQYLVEQTYRIENYGLDENATIDLYLQNPIKEFVWFCRRSDANITNGWTDFLDIDKRHAMIGAKFSFNGLDRIDEKDAYYYNYVQPFQHHRGCAKDGVYLYSFSINAEDFQPSGSVNASRINKMQMFIRTRLPLEPTYKYSLTLYAISYNLLKVSSGLAAVAYSS